MNSPFRSVAFAWLGSATVVLLLAGPSVEAASCGTGFGGGPFVVSATPTTVTVGQRITITWCDPSWSGIDAGFGASEYTVYFSYNSSFNGGNYVDDITSLSLQGSFGAQDAGRTIYIRVRAFGANNTIAGPVPATKDSNTITVVVTGGGTPTATLDVSPSSITVGGSATLTWSTTNATTTTIDGGIGPVSASGSMLVFPQATTQYTLTARNASGQTATSSRTVTVNPAPNRPVLATIEAIPNEISAGQSFTLLWETSGAFGASIDKLGTVELKSSRTLTPNGTTTYTINAGSEGGSATDSVTVIVRTQPKPSIFFFAASPGSVQQGQPVTLSWGSSGGSFAEVEGASVPLSGNTIVIPTDARATTYTLVVEGPGGRSTRTVSVDVNQSTPPVVDTPAGQPDQPGSTDGSPGDTRFKDPAAIGVDGNRNIFVVDSGNHTIRRIKASGESETWAGVAGTPGFRDGCRAGCATTALFDFSSFKGALLVKPDGSLVVSDASNRIRFVDSSGKVTTCSSASCARFSVGGMARDSQGNRYEADTGSNTILKVSPAEVVAVLAGATGIAGFQDGNGNAARFRGPRGVAVDNAGNVYVGDTGNNAIRKISPDRTVTTLAGAALPASKRTDGASNARFSFGCCGGQVAVDPVKGTIFVTDPGSNTIKRVDPDGEVSTVVGSGEAGSGDGTASNAAFDQPLGTTLTPDGHLLVADTGNHTIRETSTVVEPSGTCVPGAKTACMLNGRFRVTMRYRNGFDSGAVDTDASVKSVTGFSSSNFETSFFYFNNENNIEMMVKMLDQGNTNALGQPTIAVLYGSATPLRVELSITDTLKGGIRTYQSVFNSMKGQTDFTAFVK